MKSLCLLLASILIGIEAGAKGKYCFKTFVGEEWNFHGDCESDTRIHLFQLLLAQNQNVLNNIVKDIARLAMKEEYRRRITHKEMKLKQITLTSRNGKQKFRNVSIVDGNWMVFQRRVDGSVDFNRPWKDYVNGFGTPFGEQWLGLEALHQLTKTKDKKLRIDMIYADTGIHHFAEYGIFTVGPSSDNYKIHVDKFSANGTADALIDTRDFGKTDGMEFSTYDNDNDKTKVKNCARDQGGGWWQYACTVANLNGIYGRHDIGRGGSGIRWNDNILNYVEMKIKNKSSSLS